MLTTLLGILGDFVGGTVTYVASDLVDDQLQKMTTAFQIPTVSGVSTDLCFLRDPGEMGDPLALPAGNFGGGVTVCLDSH